MRKYVYKISKEDIIQSLIDGLDWPWVLSMDLPELTIDEEGNVMVEVTFVEEGQLDLPFTNNQGD